MTTLTETESPVDGLEEQTTLEVTPLMVQVLQSVQQLAASQGELLRAMQGWGTQIEEQHREQTAQIQALAEAIKLQNAALNARTDLLRDLANQLLAIFKTRWFTFLAGTALGLGIAGAREIIAAIFGTSGIPTP